jgi:hypothetical protein
MTSPILDLNLDLAPQDFTPTYSLPDSVEATIPVTAQPGEPGIHWVARGLLTETCARLLARPVSLDHHEGRCLTFVSTTVSMASTVASPDPRDALATVDLLLDRRSGRWVLTFRDRIVGTGGCLPSPSSLAELVAVAYDRSRRPLDLSRGVAALPEPLW